MPDPSPSDDGTRAMSPQSGSGPKPPTAAGAPTDPAVPLRIGRFEVRALLGEGAFGRVFLAFDAELERQVAIKVPKLEGFTRDMRDRFIREARATAKIHHPNVCPVHEVGTDGDLPFIVMHYQAGTTLAAHLERWKVLPPLHAVALAQKLALGVAAAHEQGVIHRDLKPQNVLFDPTRQLALITDFGLARIGGQTTATAAGAVFGTPLYMSPEQARGEVETVGPLSDVYSLGVIFYRMLTGDVPFNGSVYEVLVAHHEKQPVAPSVARRGLDPRLDGLCLKALAKRPADRYPSAKAFADALSEYTRAGDSSAWQKVNPGVERKPADPLPAPAPPAPPIPPRPLDLEPAAVDRKPPPAPPRPPVKEEPARRPPRAAPAPRPVPLPVDDPADGGALRQKVLIAGVGFLFVVLLAAVIVVVVNSKSPPTEPAVVPPTDHAGTKDDTKKPDPPKDDTKKPDPPKGEPPSIANGFAGHKFDQAAERRAAEWALAQGGELKVTPLVGAVRPVKPGDALPTDFTVSRIELRVKPGLTDAEVVANLAGLTGPVELSFQECGQIGDDTVKVLARVPKLVSVAFYRTSRITDASLGLLAGHPALVDVQLQVTGVTKAGIKHLATLRAVRQLALWVPDADEWLADLAPLTELTRLEVSAGGPGQMTERGIPHLKPFTRLRRLTLYGRNVTDAWLPQLAAVNPFPELEDLALRDTAVDGSGLADLGKLPRLDWISLNESRVTDEGLESLVKIPRLGWLMLNSTTIGNEGLRAVSKCPNLQNLMLRDNRRVTDRGMAHLAACTKLTDLDLTNTAIGDAGVHELIACKALKRLTLDGTQVTAKGIAELKDKLPGCVVIHGK